MATRTFAINTEPHQAVIGDKILLFEPEVIGSEFAEAYGALRDIQAKVKAAEGNKPSSTKHAKEAKEPSIRTELLVELSEGMRAFVRTFLLPESRQAFDGLRLPDRILVQLMEYTAELYGGGSGNPAAAGGQSSD